jgi:predicted Rossmann fold nucleotide-binding protein DprA/Smf involved in DNA uptake
MPALSTNTQAVLLLTSPLLGGGKDGAANVPVLTPREYSRLAVSLREANHQPADFINGAAEQLVASAPAELEPERLRQLLSRGFQLSQAVERWSSSSITVIGRADPGYPQRFKQRLRHEAPAVLYACGNPALLNGPALAVVGSRDTAEPLLQRTQELGALAATAGIVIVSGAARGVDETAMLGALNAGGSAIGFVADSLEKIAAKPIYREALIGERLLLLSSAIPTAGFSVGRAMGRNKFIYALADAALVVNAAKGEGGTWRGAEEQLRNYRFCPVHVLEDPRGGPGLSALLELGGEAWPTPATAAQLQEVIGRRTAQAVESPVQVCLKLDQPAKVESPGCRLQHCVDSLVLEILQTPSSDSEIAAALAVSRTQARSWLKEMESRGLIEKLSKPMRYRKKQT